MFNDIMTRGVDADGSIISSITLAALEDSGWYETDYTYGSSVSWGKNAGESFFTEKCVSSNEPNFPEFCNDFG